MYFPMPFSGIRLKITVPSWEAEKVMVALIAEMETKGHFHNFAVEIDNPDGIAFYGTESLMECIKEIVS